ncbi:hypothetical protein M1O47_00785 [Dehalococcoidia bacterium]|nr:hypothetical protein [Dehalococcoidia bacterium]
MEIQIQEPLPGAVGTFDEVPLKFKLVGDPLVPPMGFYRISVGGKEVDHGLVPGLGSQSAVVEARFPVTNKQEKNAALIVLTVHPDPLGMVPPVATWRHELSVQEAPPKPRPEMRDMAKVAVPDEIPTIRI